MKAKSYFLFLTTFFLLSLNAGAQKNNLNIDALQNWPVLKELGNRIVCTDKNGNYCAYRKRNVNGHDSTIVVELKSNRRIRLKNVKMLEFSNDPQTGCYQTEDNRIFMLDLKTGISEYLSQGENFGFIRFSKRDILLYSSHNLNTIYLKYLHSALVDSIENSKLLSINEENGQLLILKDSSVIVYNIQGHLQPLFKDKYFDEHLIFDQKNGCFAVVNKNNLDTVYFFEGNKKELIKIPTDVYNINKDIVSSDYDCSLRFSNNGDYLLLTIRYKEQFYRNTFGDGVEVWRTLGRGQTPNSISQKVFTICADLKTMQIVPLQSEESMDVLVNAASDKHGILPALSKIEISELSWNNENSYLSIFDLKTGKEHILYTYPKQAVSFAYSVSPSGNFIVWFDEIRDEYRVFNLKNRQYTHLDIPKYLILRDDNEIVERRRPYGIAGWEKAGDIVWIYDKYDIVKINLNTSKLSLIAGNGLSRKNNITFRLADRNKKLLVDSLILSGYNALTKQNGLFKYSKSNGLIYNHLAMTNHAYVNNNSSRTLYIKELGYAPISLGSGKYLVYRMSSTESGNIFITSDFVNYRQISDVNPEKLYKLPSNELLTWKNKDGEIRQGLLYKPADFDSTKKYPLIVHIYEKRSDELNIFKEPELSSAQINIPWFVGHNYLVFSPDIHYCVSNNAQSIIKSIDDAIKAISRIQYVDTSKLGIQGHSFGGYETLLAVSHLPYFKAAQETAGIFNFISEYSYYVKPFLRQSYFEKSQPNMDCPPWICKDKYIEASPLFNVEKINTPLLFVQNKDDIAVNFFQGIELYGALRRTQKPGWMLSYKEQSHTLTDEKCQKDFTVKVMEFFDHYLKNAKSPEWMRY